MSMPKGHRLVRLRDLNERHHGRTIHVAGLTGEFVGIVPEPGGARVQLALLIGGARAWTGWLDAEDAAEVWKL